MINENSSVFSKIYDGEKWGDGTRTPKSGEGSNPDNAAPYVSFVKNTIGKLKISSIVDVGHGDWSMWRDYKFEGVSYTGIDVVPGLGNQVNATHGRKGLSFIERDAEHNTLPGAEFLLCKDVLQHLPNDSALKVMSKFSNFRYVCITNDIYLSRDYLRPSARWHAYITSGNPMRHVIRNNTEIVRGDCKPINLEAAPFRQLTSTWKLLSKFDYGSNLAKRVYLFETAS